VSCSRILKLINKFFPGFHDAVCRIPEHDKEKISAMTVQHSVGYEMMLGHFVENIMLECKKSISNRE